MELIKNEQVQLSDISKAKKIYYRLMLAMWYILGCGRLVLPTTALALIVINLLLLKSYSIIAMGGKINNISDRVLKFLCIEVFLLTIILSIFFIIKAPTKIRHYNNKLKLQNRGF